MKKSVFNRFNLAWLIFSATIYAIVSFLIYIDVINAYYQITLAMIAINIILAVSLNLIIGITGQFSLGHAGFMCIGAYATAIILKMMPNYLGLFLGVVVGIVISSLTGLLIAIPTLRLRGDYLAIATLGFSEIIRIIVLNLKITNGAAGISNIPKLVNWNILFIGIFISLIIVVNYTRSALGRASISVREDEIAAEAMGVNTTKYKIAAFIIGASIASVAGAFYASFFYVIKPETFGFAKSIDILVMVVFGGMGSFTGSVIASIALGIINTSLQTLAEFRMIIYAVLLVVIMIFRPKGLLGTREFKLSWIINKFRKRNEERK